MDMEPEVEPQRWLNLQHLDIADPPAAKPPPVKLPAHKRKATNQKHRPVIPEPTHRDEATASTHY